MEFTGERVVPGKTPIEIFHEHEERYVYAASLASNKNILDIACGAGYGADYLLEGGAKSVTGVDVSLDAAIYARENYAKDNGAKFVCANAVKLPFVNACFDMIVSFETIEHIILYEDFLVECRRVLKDDGLFICSTPNKKIFSPNETTPPNHYHVKEFLPDEYKDLINRYFNNVKLYGQCNVNLRDNSVVRNKGVHDFEDNDLISSAYIISVAAK